MGSGERERERDWFWHVFFVEMVQQLVLENTLPIRIYTPCNCNSHPRHSMYGIFNIDPWPDRLSKKSSHGVSGEHLLLVAMASILVASCRYTRRVRTLSAIVLQPLQFHSASRCWLALSGRLFGAALHASRGIQRRALSMPLRSKR